MAALLAGGVLQANAALSSCALGVINHTEIPLAITIGSNPSVNLGPRSSITPTIDVTGNSNMMPLMTVKISENSAGMVGSGTPNVGAIKVGVAVGVGTLCALSNLNIAGLPANLKVGIDNGMLAIDKK